MPAPELTGAEKSVLRGRGQLMAPSIKVGQEGLTAAFFAELERQLRARELVKLRFLGLERDDRSSACERIAREGRCLCVGAVGHTALFYRAAPA